MGKDDNINNTFHFAVQDWVSSQTRKTEAGELTFFGRCVDRADRWRIILK